MNINDPNKGGQPPEGPKDANVRDQMQKIGRLIDDELPEGWGYALFTFPFDDREGRMNYAANARREDITKMIANWLLYELRDQMAGQPFGGHKDGIV